MVLSSADLLKLLHPVILIIINVKQAKIMQIV